jgi:hypothetical protein
MGSGRQALMVVALGAGLTLAACGPSTPPLEQPDNDAILAMLNARLGPDSGQRYYAGTGANGAAIYKPVRSGPRELHFVVRRQAEGERIVCGWAGYAPLKASEPASFPPFDTLFLLRNGRLYLSQDLPAGQFERWQADLCGDRWVKPIPRPR